MKKFLGFLLVLSLFIGCSDSDSNSVDENEPNDSFATANEFTADGSSNSAKIDSAGDYDYFLYYVTPGSVYSVEAEWKKGQDLDLYVDVYNQDQNMIDNLDDGVFADDELGILTVGSTTTAVYIVVSDYDEIFEGSYTIKVTPASSGGRSVTSEVGDAVSGKNGSGSLKDKKTNRFE